MITLVIGPNCGGKSTLVQAMAESGWDVVTKQALYVDVSEAGWWDRFVDRKVYEMYPFFGNLTGRGSTDRIGHHTDWILETARLTTPPNPSNFSIVLAMPDLPELHKRQLLRDGRGTVGFDLSRKQAAGQLLYMACMAVRMAEAGFQIRPAK